MSEKLIIPADIYDYHELVSEMDGGIGKGKFYDPLNDCRCIVGQRDFYDYTPMFTYTVPTTHEIIKESLILNDTIYPELYHKFYSIYTNDRVFDPTEYKISWQEYCKRRNIVRGE